MNLFEAYDALIDSIKDLADIGKYLTAFIAAIIVAIAAVFLCIAKMVTMVGVNVVMYVDHARVRRNERLAKKKAQQAIKEVANK